MKVLIIEDEVQIASLVAGILERHGYQVEVAYDGEQGLALGKMDMHDVMILDVNLPKINGFDILKQLRDAKIATPILMLTANIQTQDKVRGLRSGADDYLTKPFERDELIARVEAITRRGNALFLDEISTFGNLEFNPRMLTLTAQGEVSHLPVKEAQILELLIKHQETLVPTDWLINHVWDYEDYPSEETVRQHMSRLRKKLKLLDGRVEIKVVRKRGYQLKVK